MAAAFCFSRSAALTPVTASATAASTYSGPRPPGRESTSYSIEGQRLPSVTTILDIIAKPALGPWYAKEERRYFDGAGWLGIRRRSQCRPPGLAPVDQAVAEMASAGPIGRVGQTLLPLTP